MAEAAVEGTLVAGRLVDGSPAALDTDERLSSSSGLADGSTRDSRRRSMSRYTEGLAL